MGRLTPCGPLGFALLAAAATGARADTIVLPTFDVVATTPSGGAIDVARFPGATHPSTRPTSSPGTTPH